MKLFIIAVVVAVVTAIISTTGCVSVLGRQRGTCTTCAPSVIIYKYDYQAKPPALAPGTPPTPPWAFGPPDADYPTIYASAWDDPTLVIFKNDSYRKIRIEVNGQRPIILEPYGATADLHLGVGEHPVRLVIKKPTRAHGTLEVVRFFKIHIRPEGRSQIFHIYNY